MAFINAYMTDEEIRAFAEAEIPDPRWKLVKRPLKPWQWTVDRERGIALISCGAADREHYEIETFAFVSTDLKKGDILPFEIMQDHDGSIREKLQKEYNVNLVLFWNVLKIENLHRSEIAGTKDEFMELLEEALTAYGADGSPDFIPNVKVFVEYGKNDKN